MYEAFFFEHNLKMNGDIIHAMHPEPECIHACVNAIQHVTFDSRFWQYNDCYHLRLSIQNLKC